MTGKPKSFISDESGATAIEYALIAVLMSVFIIGSVSLVGDEIVDMFAYISQAVAGAIGE